jgi:hypothetical protein
LETATVSGHSPGDPIRQRDMYRKWIDSIDHATRIAEHAADVRVAALIAAPPTAGFCS